MKKAIFLLAAFCAVTCIACKKKEAPPPEPPDITPTTTNIVGNYRYEKVTNIYAGEEQDITTIWLQSCQMDDVTKFNSNFTFAYMDAGVACERPGDKQGKWSLPDTLTLVMKNEPYTIRKFNGKRLELSQTFSTSATVVTHYLKLN